MNLAKIVRTQWDRVTAAGLVVAALAALFLGWLGISGTAFPAEQIPYLVSGGLLAVCLIAIGTTLWLSADLRDEWVRIDQLDATIQEQTTVLRQCSVTSAAGNEPQFARTGR